MGEEQAIVGVRHGGQMKNGHYRVYGKFYQHNSFVDAQGHETNDNWETCTTYCINLKKKYFLSYIYTVLIVCVLTISQLM